MVGGKKAKFAIVYFKEEAASIGIRNFYWRFKERWVGGDDTLNLLDILGDKGEARRLRVML